MKNPVLMRDFVAANCPSLSSLILFLSRALMHVYCCAFVLGKGIAGSSTILSEQIQTSMLTSGTVSGFLSDKMSNICIGMHCFGHLHMQNLYNIAVVYFYY